MTLLPLDPRVRTVWRLKVALWLALPLLAALAVDVVALLRKSPWLPPGVLSASVVGLGVLLVAFIPLRYRAWRYALTDEELFLERGLLNRVRTVVPLRRIQHLDVSQDLLEREFGLGKLIVHTAGTRSSDVVVPGLAFETAESLRDRVKRFLLTDDTV